jgi:hypothetical protein
MSSKKSDALAKIAALAQEYSLTLDDIKEAMIEAAANPEDRQGSILQTLLSYLGGLFIFAGIAVFIGMFWGDMNTAGRLIVTMGSGFSAYLLALLFMKEDKFAKAVTPLFLIAAILQPTGILVMLDAFSTGGDPRHGALFMTGVMALQQGGTFIAKKRTLLAFTTLCFLMIFITTALDLTKLDDEIISLIVGIMLMSVSYRLGKSPHALLAPFGYFIGSVCTMAGSFEIIENSPLEILFLGITSGFIYLSTIVKSRTLLFASSLGMLCYIGYFSAEHFANSVGWPLTLIILGLIMLGLASFVFKLNRQIKDES